MKIQVRDDQGKPLGALQIKVIDLDEKQAAQQNNGLWQRWLEKVILKFAKKSDHTRKSKKSDDKIKTVEINISLPSLSVASIKQLAAGVKALPRRKKSILLASLVGIIAAVALVITLGSHNKPTAAATTGQEHPALTRGTPNYPTVLPAGKTITSLGGWVRISPPGRNPVYTYTDKISGIQVDVSEQPLPANFKNDTDNKISQLAQNFSANDKLMAGDTPVYVGTSAQGPQSVIFTRKNLLILIKSTSFISNDQWVTYVNSLQ